MQNLSEDSFLFLSSMTVAAEYIAINKDEQIYCTERWLKTFNHLESILPIMIKYKFYYSFEYETKLFNQFLDEPNDSQSFFITTYDKHEVLTNFLVDYMIHILIQRDMDTLNHIEKTVLYFQIREESEIYPYQQLSSYLLELIHAMVSQGRSIYEKRFARLASYCRSFFAKNPQLITEQDHLLLYSPNQNSSHPLYYFYIPHYGYIKNQDYFRQPHQINTNIVPIIPSASSDVPFFIHHVINLCEKGVQAKLVQEYMSFKKNFIKINNQLINRDFHYRDFDFFILNNHIKIAQLVFIMNKEAFVYLKSHMASTVITLERMMENMAVLPLEYLIIFQKIFDKYQTEITSNPTKRKLWERVLLDIGIQINNDKIYEAYVTQQLSNSSGSDYQSQERSIDADRMTAKSLEHQAQYYAEDYENLLTTTPSFESFVLEISKYCLKKAFYRLGINESELSQQDLERIDMNYFSKLMHAKMHMRDDYYHDLFEEMLKLDLTGQSINNFLHDVNQENYIGSKVAHHNQRIKTKLESAGINTSLAMNYQKKLEFTVEKRSGINQLKEIINTLLNDISRLNQEIQTLSATKYSNNLTKISSAISKIHENLNRSQTLEMDLLKPHNMDLLLIIKKNLVFILSKDHISNDFKERADHYLDRLARLVNYKSVFNEPITAEEFSQTQSFEVVQWDKSTIETYWLGDEVGCCLATDGAQFQALIQRRMDDAMFFHVVMSMKTHKPVALAWLYFAEDANSGKIYIMANFLEIHDSITIKMEIIGHLLTFIDNYAKDVGAAGFLISPLYYGVLPDFTCFDPINFSPKKVGGCLCLEGKVNDSSTDILSLYYLESLRRKTFHQFDQSKFKNTYFPNTPTSSLLNVKTTFFEQIKPVINDAKQPASSLNQSMKKK